MKPEVLFFGVTVKKLMDGMFNVKIKLCLTTQSKVVVLKKKKASPIILNI